MNAKLPTRKWRASSQTVEDSSAVIGGLRRRQAGSCYKQHSRRWEKGKTSATPRTSFATLAGTLGLTVVRTSEGVRVLDEPDGSSKWDVTTR